MRINGEMKTSKEGLEHIKKWEGLVLKRYICPAGKPTIGVGHVILPGENYQVITEEQAMQILSKDVERFEAAVKKHITVPLNQNQFDAIVGFIFNTGEGGIINTGVQKAINSGDFESVPSKLEEWSKIRVNGVLKVNKGLLNRRKSEGQLFSKKIELKDVSSSPQKNEVLVWDAGSLKIVQECLRSLGLYRLKVDGLWGPGTLNGLKAFAKNNESLLGNDPSKQIPLSFFSDLKKAAEKK